MAKPNDRSQFSEYCLRKLGSPVIQINVDDDQVSDRIDEALGLFREFHHDSMSHEYFIYTITADDIINEYIPITSDVLAVVNVAVATEATNSSWTTNYGQFLRGVWASINFGQGIGGCGLLGDYSTTMTRLADIEFMFMSNPQWNFYQYMNRLTIHESFEDLFSEGDKIMVEIYRQIDETTYGQIWGDRWLLQYGTALIGQQWGSNLSKYDGVQLPGGITLDGDKLYDRYTTEIQKLEEELELKYQLPIDFMVG